MNAKGITSASCSDETTHVCNNMNHQTIIITKTKANLQVKIQRKECHYKLGRETPKVNDAKRFLILLDCRWIIESYTNGIISLQLWDQIMTIYV